MSSARTCLALVVLTVPGVAAAADWTVFTPSPDSRVIYVSNSTGNDANNGLSEQTPKKTLGAGYALLRDGYPDWLLLKCGDTWDDRFASWSKSGRSGTEVMRLGSYGTGARPLLRTGASHGLEATSPASPARGNLAITDVHFKAHTYNGSNGGPFGISLYGPFKNVLIENCKVEGYFTNMPLQGYPEQRMTNISVRRNVIVDAYKAGTDGHPQGLLIGHCNGGLVEENILDHNGWNESVSGAVPTIFRHNVYINPDNTTGMKTLGNIVARGAASGLRSGGEVCEHNLLLANPVSIVLTEDARACRYNVVIDSRDLTSNDPRGLGAIIRNSTNLDFSHNIFAQRSYPGYYNIAALDIGGGVNNSQFRSNVIYKWNPPGENVGQAILINDSPWALTFSDNILQQTGGGRVVWDNSGQGNYSLSGNKHFSTNSQPFHRYSALNFTGWVQATGESGSSFGQHTMPDPNRSIATYMQSIGMTASLDAFMTEARKQSKQNWRPQFTAQVVGNYMRAGFGLPPVGGTVPCPADFTGDGVVSVADALLFMNAFTNSDPRADINRDGALNIVDYVTFQNAIATGCP